MKQLLIIIVTIVTLSSCCGFQRSKEYQKPETSTVQTSAFVIGETKDQVWDKLIIGLRDAYSNGLAISIPTGLKELGWAMV